MAWLAAGIGTFVIGGLAGGLAIPPGAVLWVGAAFVFFILCVRQAIVLWRVDEMVFDHERPRKPKDPVTANPVSGRFLPRHVHGSFREV